jgi:transketolase
MSPLAPPPPRQPSADSVATTLTARCVRVRQLIIDTLGVIGSGHPGPALSLVEILVSLYFDEMRCDPADPAWSGRDYLVLSKGHGALALYATLAARGYFPERELHTFECLGSRLQGHPDCRLTPGVEVSTGSLGQGLSFAAGIAIGAQRKGIPNRAYCILGDGECQEGNVWEAAMTAAKFRLDNLLAIVDWNNLQGGVTREVMPSLEPFEAKWRAFGWEVFDVPGHDVSALRGAYAAARAVSGRPSLIIARTVKGKGVSFMENDPEWHGQKLAGAALAKARREVGLDS